MLFPNQRFIFTDELEYNMAWLDISRKIQGYQITLNFWDTTVLNARTKATNTKNQ